MTCAHCGMPTPKAVCRQCRLAEQAEERARLRDDEETDAEDEIVTDGGRTLRDAAEPGMVGVCTECDGQMIETVVAINSDRGTVTLVCDDCDTEVRIEYLVGETNPWAEAEDVPGIRDVTVEPIAWVDCRECNGTGEVFDPLCDLRRAMYGREHPCHECDATGSVPQVVSADETAVTDGGTDRPTPTTLGYRILYILCGHARTPEALLSELQATFDADISSQAARRTCRSLLAADYIRETDVGVGDPADAGQYVITSRGRRRAREELAGALTHVSDVPREDTGASEHRLLTGGGD